MMLVLWSAYTSCYYGGRNERVSNKSNPLLAERIHVTISMFEPLCEKLFTLLNVQAVQHLINVNIQLH